MIVRNRAASFHYEISEKLEAGIVLKGSGWVELWPQIWPMLLFTAVVMGVALRFYRRTLD